MQDLMAGLFKKPNLKILSIGIIITEVNENTFVINRWNNAFMLENFKYMYADIITDYNGL